jgi:hypothetical protein
LLGDPPAFVKEYPSIFQEFEDRKWVLLYRGGRDGFGAKSFHDKCDEKAPTMTVVQSRAQHEFPSRVFGGYTPVKWDSISGLKSEPVKDPTGFLFNLSVPGTGEAKRYPLRAGEKTKAIYCNSTYGPAFGSGQTGGCCLSIGDKCDEIPGSNTVYGDTYSMPEKEAYFNDTRTFLVEEIEIFQLL